MVVATMPGDGAVMKHSLKRPPMRLSLAASSLIGALLTYRTSDSAAGAFIARAECGKRSGRLPDIAGEFELVPRRRTFGLAAEAAQAARNIGLKSNARLFAVVAHVNTGFDLFADHMRGCRLHLAGERGGPGILLRLQRGIRRQVGRNEGDDGPGNEADRLSNFFPGAQAIWADDIDLCFGFVGLATFNDLREGRTRHAAEVAPRHDHEVRVESLFGSIAARSFPTIS